MAKKVLLCAAAFGAASVILGALASHKLEPLLTAKSYAAFKTGVQYQSMHAVSLLALIGLQLNQTKLNLNFVYNSFIAGIILFSGSLYLLAVKDLIGASWLSNLGFITPIGGLLFISGWVGLFMIIRKNFQLAGS